jgi:hypothetical protein
MMVSKLKTKLLMTAAMIAFVMAPALVMAGEVKMGTAYTAEELAEVRAWEKTWVGKKIDQSNVDQIGQFLPESYLGIYKDPQKWGAPPEGFHFTIVPYRPVQESKGFIEATEKYNSQVKVDENGVITNMAEIAGRPFLEPKTGLEIMWNFELNNHGDTFNYRKYTPNINPKTRTERMADQEYWEFYFINRTELDPKPALPVKQNKKEYRRGMFMTMFKPAEFLNTRMYTLRHIDQSKQDITYLWYNQFRRIRRLSTNQRTDSIDGSDLIYDDEYLWDGQLTRNNYTLKGKKDLLCSRNESLVGTTRTGGQGMLNGLKFERCNMYVVEAINKDPNYIYSKRVMYLDPETYLIMWLEIYDEKGRFWKCFGNFTRPLKTETGSMKPSIVGTVFNEFQRTHSGLSDSERIQAPRASLPLSEKMFTIGYLQKTY